MQPGDTLSTSSRRIEGAAVGLWPAVDLVFAANPDAFIDNDPNKLKAGSWFTIPDMTASRRRLFPGGQRCRRTLEPGYIIQPLRRRSETLRMTATSAAAFEEPCRPMTRLSHVEGVAEPSSVEEPDRAPARLIGAGRRIAGQRDGR